MRRVVAALIVAGLALILTMGCSNDENTVNSIPKYHNVYPVFHLKIDNGRRQFGIDSVLLTPTPDIGWLGPVYSDKNGFIGTLASGTFVTDVDTSFVDDSMVVESTSVVFGFQPGARYKFKFDRQEPFIWLDSFRAEYAVTVDSLWVRFSVDTIKTTKVLDPDRPPVRSVQTIRKDYPPTITPPPDSVYMQELLYGWWFDTAFVIANPADTVDFPPDSFFYDTVKWGFWHKVDSFYLPPDSQIWCTLDSTHIRKTIYYDIYNNPMVVIDTLYFYGNCDPRIDTTKNRVYRQFGWGTYPGGDSTQPPIPVFDTTIHFTYPDTMKGLIFDGDNMKIFTWDEVPGDTLSETLDVDIEFLQNGTSSPLDSLTLDLTMPLEERQPDYRIIIREVPNP
jgi:hypothetical protein